MNKCKPKKSEGFIVKVQQEKKAQTYLNYLCGPY